MDFPCRQKFHYDDDDDDDDDGYYFIDSNYKMKFLFLNWKSCWSSCLKFSCSFHWMNEWIVIKVFFYISKS